MLDVLTLEMCTREASGDVNRISEYKNLEFRRERMKYVSH